MFNSVKLMFLYTETPLHCGSGTSLGIVDLPIQRERYTDYPVCQASGIKGAVRDWFEMRNRQNGNRDDEKIRYTFGPELDKNQEALAGAATFTDARILLFPVRSLKEVFAYITSPLALSRFKRDSFVGGNRAEWKIPEFPENEVVGIPGTQLGNSGKVVLEEYVFNLREDENAKSIGKWLAENAFPGTPEYDFWRNKVKKDLLIVSDTVFRDFVKLSTEVQTRIKIDNETKTASGMALFCEESLPPDCLLYSLAMASDPSVDSNKRPADLKNKDEVIIYLSRINGERIQFGGDATIGRGIVNIRLGIQEAK